MEIVRTIDRNTARDGVYIPLDVFAGHEGIEIRIADDGAVTIRPRRRSLADVCKNMDARRKALERDHGLFSDSSLLIREDRDKR